MSRIEIEFGANFEKYYSDINRAINETKSRMSFIEKGFADELVSTNASLEELTANVGDFVKMNNLNEMQLKNVVKVLEQQKSILTVGGEAYKTHEKAINAINLSMQNYTNQSGNVRTNQNSMNQALSQFGWVLGDANMFMVNFRMGMQSIGNNIPMVVQGFAQASAEAKNLDISVGRHLLNSLKGFGGIMLGVNGIMFLLQVLPGLFDDATASVKKQAEEVKNLKEEYSRLTREQINNSLTAKQKELDEIKARHPAVEYSVFNASSMGGGVSVAAKGQRLYGRDNDRVKQLDNEIKALKEANYTLGDIEDVENRISLNRQRLDDLNKNNIALYKDVGNNYDQIKKKLEQWIAADEKLNVKHTNTIKKIKEDLTDLSVKGFTAQSYFDFLQTTPQKRNPRTSSGSADLTSPGLAGFNAQSYFDFLQDKHVRNPRSKETTEDTDKMAVSTQLLGMAWNRTGDIMNSALNTAINKMENLSDVSKQFLSIILSTGLSFLTGGLFGAIGGGNFITSGLQSIGIKMANGGVIAEPVVGMGLNSKQSYLFGEAGNEIVIPASRYQSGGMGGYQKIDLNLNLKGIVSGKDIHLVNQMIQKEINHYK